MQARSTKPAVVVSILGIVLCIAVPGAAVPPGGSRGGDTAETPSPEVQIAGAVAAAPLDLGEKAAVLGYDEEGKLVRLREGEGELVCLADDPSDSRFHTACYHKGLETFMERGRELAAEGVKSSERHRIRHEEIDAGKLAMPKEPTSLYTVTGTAFDPETGEVAGAKRVYVIYLPYATGASTGLPTGPDPKRPSAPWIMRMGTPSAHVMITPDLGKNDG